VKQDFINNELYYGIKMHDVIRAFGLQAAVPGKPSYVSDESEEKTYAVTIGEDGSISDPKLFAEQGGKESRSIQRGMFISPQVKFLYTTLQVH